MNPDDKKPAARRRIWTLEECRAAAKRYRSKTEWATKHPSTYRQAQRLRWLPLCSDHMTEGNQSWTLEACQKEAAKHQTRRKWQKASPRSYDAATRHGWLDDCVGHMVKKLNQWTLEKCQKAAALYAQRSQWKRSDPQSYWAAQRHGWLDLCAAHMVIKLKSWTLEECKSYASRYSTRKQWARSHEATYRYARKRGWLDACCTHMQYVRQYWTPESCLSEARRFASPREWEAKSPLSYNAACKQKLLNEIYAHAAMIKTGGTSLPEKDLCESARQLSKDVVAHFRIPSSRQSVDVYFSAAKIGIELNGLYWHNEDHKSKRYHLDKTNACKEQGIRLIHIWEHEWRDRRGQVLSFLRSALGVNHTKIGARRCEFRWVEPSEVRALLGSTHIQGYTPSQHAIGVYYQGELVGCATFGKHHRGKPVTVLNRLVFKDDVTVSGGFSKISKMAAERFGTIISWVDLAKSDGQGYLKAGWKVEEVLKPDYFYHDSRGNVFSKQSRKKSAVKTPEGMTEREHALQDGLHRVWDCGKMRMAYKLETKPELEI